MNLSQRSHVEFVALVSTLSALALVLGFVETMIALPIVLPGMKLGLANAAVLIAIFAYDVPLAACIALVKVLATGLVFGSPIMMAYSVTGTLFAFAGMLVCKSVANDAVVFASMIAAVLHNVGQVLVAWLMLGSASIVFALPPLALAACFTGAFVGMVSKPVIRAKLRTRQRPVVDVPAGFDIAPGEFVALVGKNGSGKSSFATQWAKSSGKRVGICFQNIDDQLVTSIVSDDVAFGLENEGAGQREMSHRVEDALHFVDAEGFAQSSIQNLSGGQKSLVAIAGMLATSCDVLVLDEVTSSLDLYGRRSFFDLVKRLRESGRAVVLITHDGDELRRTDKVFVVDDCKIAASCSPEDFFENDALIEASAFLLPDSVKLARLLKDKGVRISACAAADEVGEAICRLRA